jgi:hypothetical protein
MIAGSPIWKSQLPGLARHGRPLYTFELPNLGIVLSSFVPSDVGVTIPADSGALRTLTVRPSSFYVTHISPAPDYTPDAIDPNGVITPGYSMDSDTNPPQSCAVIQRYAYGARSWFDFLYWTWQGILVPPDLPDAVQLDITIWTARPNGGLDAFQTPYAYLMASLLAPPPTEHAAWMAGYPGGWLEMLNSNTPTWSLAATTMNLWPNNTGTGVTGFPDITKLRAMASIFNAWDLSVTETLQQLEIYDVYLTITLPPLKTVVFPGMNIPAGQGQSVNELDGAASISSLAIEAIDPHRALRRLIARNDLLGQPALFRMGFPGMSLADFTALHTMQLSDAGRSSEGWCNLTVRDPMVLVDQALWCNGGPAPVALPWTYNTSYQAGQYIQDANGNIQQAQNSGISSATTLPVWPGTQMTRWQQNTAYGAGAWCMDSNGNIQYSPAYGVSSMTEPTWNTVKGGTTSDHTITWTLVAINALGQTTLDGTITWEYVAGWSGFPDYNIGAFGGRDYFYVYDSGQAPWPPQGDTFASNGWPTADENPRYLFGNPIDILLVALQNELGLGQDPSLDPVVTSDPDDPEAGVVFAPNPLWQQYTPGDDSTLINPNPLVDVPGLLALRDGQFSGDRMEFTIKRVVTGKDWLEQEIMAPLSLYMFVRSTGQIAFKSMKQPLNPVPVALDRDDIIGIPDQERLPIVNVVTLRLDVDDSGATTAARTYQSERTFAELTSLAKYKQQFAHSLESNGLRLNYGAILRGFLHADRVFRRHAFGTPQYTMRLNLSHLDLELGDFVSVTHSLMADYQSEDGALGITDVMCEIVDRQPHYDEGYIELKVLDTRFMQLSTPRQIASADADLPAWIDATEAERSQYLYISTFPGIYLEQYPYPDPPTVSWPGGAFF